MYYNSFSEKGCVPIKVATKERAKEAEAPHLAKSQLKKKIKYWIILFFF